MKKIILTAVALSLLSGCSASYMFPQAETVTTESLSGKNFQINGIEGIEESEAYAATLSFEDTDVSGKGYCNLYTGGYSIDDSKILIGNVASTRRLCPEEQMKLESELFLILSKELSLFKTESGYSAKSELGTFHMSEIK